MLNQREVSTDYDGWIEEIALDNKISLNKVAIDPPVELFCVED
jgi:hypothetical protein